MNYTILKVLNNNSLLVQAGQDELIIVGKGIGFKKKPLDKISKQTLIEKKYHLFKDSDLETKSQTPKKIIQDTASIINMVMTIIPYEISEASLYAFSNHVISMLICIENKEVFANPFHYETITLYKDSYQLALNLSEEIKQNLDIILPGAEVDYLTLYIHSLKNYGSIDSVPVLNAIISEINEVLEDELDEYFDKTSLDYARFITHIKFIVKRIQKKDLLPSLNILKDISDTYPSYRKISETIASVLEKHLHSKISEEEHAYIILHLARLTMKK